jgi:hypothetical protein
MKLLVVGPDMRDLRRVKNFTGIYAYYLMRELRRRGVMMRFVDGKHKDPIKYLADVDGRGCDHVLALGLRWFTHQPPGCSAIMKTKVPGAVTQLHDGVIHAYWAPLMNSVDCTFTFRDDSTRTRDWGRYATSYHYIGWAADHDLYPEQRSDELRILIIIHTTRVANRIPLRRQRLTQRCSRTRERGSGTAKDLQGAPADQRWRRR